jgi:hypothetical protein
MGLLPKDVRFNLSGFEVKINGLPEINGIVFM